MKRKPRQEQAGLELEIPAGIAAGVDEAGRGCLAGPVAAAACILPEVYDLPGLDDSKKLSPERREVLARGVKSQALAWSVALSWPAEIDRTDILAASLAAMARAVGLLRLRPGLVLVDGNQAVPGLILPQRAIVGGDGLVPAISAASILAKTFRDRLMSALARRYPGYGLERHFGYGTAEHCEAIRRLGPCPMHRMTFRKVRPEAESAETALCLPGI